VQRARELRARAVRDLSTLVEVKYREMTKARDQFDTLDRALELARENLRVRTLAFREGLATTLEVVDAQVQLSKTQTERVAAAYQFDVALAELLEAGGQSERFDEYRRRGEEVREP
jgi:outer membrane protein TolC